jgi:DNA repair protein RecO (recombination protein O)
VREIIVTNAFLLRAVTYRESDVVATWLSESRGLVSSLARGARRSRKRMGGALEPMHTAQLELEEPPARGGELMTLKAATVVRVRTGLVSSLEAMEGAGQALRWVRKVCAPKTPEPRVYQSLEALLDTLDGVHAPPEVELRVSCFGVQLLSFVGYELSFGECAVCGRPRPDGRPAFVDAARGGVVCGGCGGAGKPWTAALLGGLSAGAAPVVVASVAKPAELRALALFVQQALELHAGAGDAAVPRGSHDRG